jgi:hypothetical protein
VWALERDARFVPSLSLLAGHAGGALGVTHGDALDDDAAPFHAHVRARQGKARTHPSTVAETYTHTHTHTYTLAQMHQQSHTYIHTHTHTHTHTYSPCR